MSKYYFQDLQVFLSTMEEMDTKILSTNEGLDNIRLQLADMLILLASIDSKL